MAVRILVIEDNDANLALMDYLLQAFGYVTLLAQGGITGLSIAKHELPDLILCDIQMPVLDGFAVAKILKKDAFIFLLVKR